LYLPSDDTFLLAESAKGYNGTSALEIGVGSGLILKILQQNFKIVVGTDVDFIALSYCRKSLPNNIFLTCCDAASAINCKFDLILTNPPYLPYGCNEEKDPSIHGGVIGIESTLHFIKSAIPRLKLTGRILLVTSTVSDNEQLYRSIDEMNLNYSKIKEKRLFFESLSTMELRFK
jgi:release factor glutamine methyltransferase